MRKLVRGLYTGASGMTGEMVRSDVIANNLANVNTTGFKREHSVFRTFPEVLIRRINDAVVASPGGLIDLRPAVGVMGAGVLVDEIMTDHAQGPLRQTQNSLDLAIVGPGFFVVQTPGGERLTRNGAFTVGPDGVICTAEGYPVLGQAGPIVIRGEQVLVDENGGVTVDGKPAGRFRVVSFPAPVGLTKLGDTLFAATPEAGEAQPAGGFRVEQGFLEMANVNVVSEMVNLIAVIRAYEANQKVVQAHDETLGRAVNSVARV